MIGLTSVILAGCQSQDEVPVVPTPVPVPEEPVRDYVLADLALSLPASSAASTRLSETVVQQSDNFRGVSQLTLVPFFTQGKVTVTDLPTYCETGSLKRDFETTLAANERYRYYEKFHLKHGVASFLTYGRSDPGTATKAERGSLLATVDGTTAEGIPVGAVVSPGNLSFALDPIYNSVAAEASVKARAIADYLTYIAETPGWEDHTNPTLKTLYQNFISEVNGEYGVIAGSSVNVVAYVNDLYQKMEAQTSSNDYSASAPAFRNVVDGVMTRITDYTSDSDELTLTKSGATITGLGACNDYPDCYGLPDGAAVLQWGWDDSLKKYVFLPRTETTTSAPISGAKRYAYPPELYYYGNSTIQTSNEEVPLTDYTDSWANVLSTKYKDGTVVSSNTLAVAIKDHMQYAVAHLKATVQADATLKDAADQTITVGSESFPVTGLIVSGQHPVGFDFRPETVDNGDDHECFVYDNQLSTSPLYLTDTESVPIIHTLLLQTKENEAVTMILEVKNDSGQDFMGKNGVVFKGTKFYLVGKVKPAKGDASDSDVTEQDDLKKRVFTQDHTTEMTMKVKTLKEAFNVMPNIQTGRLEVSVEVVLKWNQTDPFSFQFEE